MQNRRHITNLIILILVLFSSFIIVVACTQTQETNEDSYDYIVVGSGPGGSACAYQLTKSGVREVLVLEAGPNWDNKDVVKYADDLLPFTNQIHFLPISLPNPNLIDPARGGPRQARKFWARMLGGGSAHNGAIWTLPSVDYYNQWAAITGGPWNTATVVSILDEIRTLRTAPDNHLIQGIGPLIVGQETHHSPFSDAVVNSIYTVCGQPPTACNTFSSFENASLVQATHNPGKKHNTFAGPAAERTWASESFLKPQKTLTVLAEAPVLRVLFEGTKAVGVEYFYQGQSKKAFATKGVILAAGAANTPKILNVSGIGESEKLTALGITPVSQVPAGKHYQDRVISRVLGTMDPKVAINSFTNGRTIEGAVADVANAFIADPTRSLDSKKRGIQFEIISQGISNTSGRFVLHAYLLKPKSEGVSGAANNDPTWNAIYEPNLLADPQDVISLVEIVRLQRRIYDEMAQQIPNLIPDDPTFTTSTFLTNAAERETWVRKTVTPGGHESGSCRMGPNDGTNVVGSKGEVYGTEHLYIADTSVAPFVYEANTQSLAYIVGTIIGKQLTGEL